MPCYQSDADSYTEVLHNYMAVSYLALGLTFFNFVALRCNLFRNFAVLPSSTIRGFICMEIAMAVLKFTAAILLLTVLYPTCPTDCVCHGFNPFYPYICLLIGSLWVMNAQKINRMLKARDEAVAESGEVVEGYVAVTDATPHYAVLETSEPLPPSYEDATKQDPDQQLSAVPLPLV